MKGGLAQLVERVLSMHEVAGSIPAFSMIVMTSWPSGLRRYVQVVVLVGVGSNPTDVIPFTTYNYHTYATINRKQPFHSSKQYLCGMSTLQHKPKICCYSSRWIYPFITSESLHDSSPKKVQEITITKNMQTTIVTPTLKVCSSLEIEKPQVDNIITTFRHT